LLKHQPCDLGNGVNRGFSLDHLPILDDQNKTIHERGVSRERGLYFVGFPWLNSRKSGIIYGVEEDANFITNAIHEQLASL